MKAFSRTYRRTHGDFFKCFCLLLLKLRLRKNTFFCWFKINIKKMIAKNKKQASKSGVTHCTQNNVTNTQVKENLLYVESCQIFSFQKCLRIIRFLFIIRKLIYHDFLPTPRRGSHVKSGKTHTQSSRYTP